MSNELEIILTKYANAVLDAKNGKTNPALGELVDKPKQAIEALIDSEVLRARIDEAEKLCWAVDTVRLHQNNHYDAQQAIEERLTQLQEPTNEKGSI